MITQEHEDTQEGAGSAPARPEDNDGYVLASVVLAFIGVVSGLVPFTEQVSFACGAVAALCGAFGYIRTTSAVALAGMVLGLVAVVVGAVGADSADVVDREFNHRIERTNAPCRPGAGYSCE
ncbi:hypothetical protein FHX42_004261 [Saccharopolyspora lacisalsi]|uniref:Uncharacterized protein n=1 Tax=Halosaccharopolyspora lacisalsi TaxID=1000566 RepID=A0A839DY45_9PSEU|nr:hypothetical protein [Halosaccharopolyspora lacisalsi]MBA8826882.1 hypothetical protein [Halosaccharopolyspora lacisalsi]